MSRFQIRQVLPHERYHLRTALRCQDLDHGGERGREFWEGRRLVKAVAAREVIHFAMLGLVKRAQERYDSVKSTEQALTNADADRPRTHDTQYLEHGRIGAPGGQNTEQLIGSVSHMSQPATQLHRSPLLCEYACVELYASVNRIVCHLRYARTTASHRKQLHHRDRDEHQESNKHGCIIGVCLSVWPRAHKHPDLLPLGRNIANDSSDGGGSSSTINCCFIFYWPIHDLLPRGRQLHAREANIFS